MLVQGPLSQSPRMRAHACVLARAGASVAFSGYVDADFEPDPAIRASALPGHTAPAWRGATLRALSHALVMPSQARYLRDLLAGADLVIMQVPPVAPATFGAIAAAGRSGSAIVVDWHNLPTSMAALSYARRHPAMAVAASLEKRFAGLDAVHLAVTPELSAVLARTYGTDAAVLPDLPGRFDRGAAPLPSQLAALGLAGLDPGRRWRIAVCPTSFTADEDLSLLAAALERLQIPPGLGLAVAVTGKGRGRAAFDALARGLARPGLAIGTGFLPLDGYRSLLAGADIGISVHLSASGLDYPMKLVDMRAAGLPALAFDYGGPLRRLAHHDASGVFRTAEDLAGELARALATPPPRRPPETADRFEAAWHEIVAPLVLARSAARRR